MFESLQSLINCEEFNCANITKHHNEDDEDDENDEGQNDDGDLRSIIDALLYFVIDPHGNGTIDIHYDQNNDHEDEYNNDVSFLPPQQQSSSSSTTSTTESQPNQKWEPTRIQILAMTALTKVILNTEFLQRYCTSITVLPDDAIDSLLGNDMGIGLSDIYKEDMTQIVQMSMCYLSSLKREGGGSRNSNNNPMHSSSTPTNYERKDQEMFSMACMSLLSSLFRTNGSIWMLVEVPPRLTKKMISNLYQIIEQTRNFDSEMKMKQKSLHVLSILAQSLLLVVEWKSPGSTNLGNFNSIVDDQCMMRLTRQVFSFTLLNGEPQIQQASSLHLFIHLCLVRDDMLKKLLNDNEVACMIKEWIIQFIQSERKGIKGHDTFCFVMTHFLEFFPRSRRILCKIFEQSEREEMDDSTMYQRFFTSIHSTDYLVRSRFS